MFYTLLQHRTTDPACARFNRPTGWWSWRRFNRNRGKSCPVCFYGAMTESEAIEWLGNLATPDAPRPTHP